jgi:hypothetical protein
MSLDIEYRENADALGFSELCKKKLKERKSRRSPQGGW